MNLIQAEIDAAAEMIDFFRFNAFFGKELLKYQPISEQPDSTLNLMRYRSLEGFVASISPFNFTAIAGNLGYTPAIMVCPILAMMLRVKSLIRLTWVYFRATESCGNPATRPYSPTTRSTKSSATQDSLTVSSTLSRRTGQSSAKP